MTSTTTPWTDLADSLVGRLALTVRLADGLAPRDFAGMFVDHTDIDRILRTLPGLDGPPHDPAVELIDRLDPLVAKAREAFSQYLLDDDDPFAEVVAASGLTTLEAEILAVAAAVEAHPDRQRLLAYIQDDVGLTRPTLDTLRRLFGDEAVRSVHPEGRLQVAGLVRLDGDLPFSRRMVVPPARLMWALSGVDPSTTGLPGGFRLIQQAGSGSTRLVVTWGGDRVSRRRTVMAHTSAPRYLVGPALADPSAWEGLVLEATLRQAGIVVEVEDQLPWTAAEILEQADHLVWGLSSQRPLPVDRLPRRRWQEVETPITVADAADWAPLQPPPGRRLDPTRVELVRRAHAGTGDPARALRRLTAGQLEEVAVRVEPRRAWRDLVLPEDEAAQLGELAVRFRHRGTVYEEWGFRPLPSAGVVALFSGPSGTGKTLAAEILAGDLGLELYKVDLSAVVSKYIGETEKNLERVFAAAEAGDAMLFFDEADALFGKRSEVGDAHDRYANIETSYLLQRLETHDGLVVLATNLRRNLDQAFLRRIHVAVEFPLPDEAARRSIWELALPEDAPTARLDLDFLARQFKISGGSIRNAALTAGFLAAHEASPITMEHVIAGLKREFQKLGRLRTDAEFDRYADLVRQPPARAG